MIVDQKALNGTCDTFHYMVQQGVKNQEDEENFESSVIAKPENNLQPSPQVNFLDDKEIERLLGQST